MPLFLFADVFFYLRNLVAGETSVSKIVFGAFFQVKRVEGCSFFRAAQEIQKSVDIFLDGIVFFGGSLP